MWDYLLNFILKLIEPVVSRVLGAIGFGMVTYSGINTLIETIQQHMVSKIGSLTANVHAILAMLGVGECITVLLSAVLIRAYLNGMSSAGTLLRSIWVSKNA